MRELSKLITLLENDPKAGRNILKNLEVKDSLVVGITGNPGVGKSTLVDGLIGCYRKRDMRVGVVAVDPSSPFSGGAFLGDRIRMKNHFLDDGVFIRSLASRGSLGGISDAVFDVVELMKAFGFDVVIIETVGAGQSEVDVAYVADTVILVVSPGGGDDIQLLKAGIVEIADVFVVNKSDLPGADITVMNIKSVLEISNRDWKPPVIETVATTGKGIDDLCEAIDSHRRYLIESGEMEKRKTRRMRKHAQHILVRRLSEILDRIEFHDVDDAVRKTLSILCGEVDT